MGGNYEAAGGESSACRKKVPGGHKSGRTVSATMCVWGRHEAMARGLGVAGVELLRRPRQAGRRVAVADLSLEATELYTRRVPAGQIPLRAASDKPRSITPRYSRSPGTPS